MLNLWFGVVMLDSTGTLSRDDCVVYRTLVPKR